MLFLLSTKWKANTLFYKVASMGPEIPTCNVLIKQQHGSGEPILARSRKCEWFYLVPWPRYARQSVRHFIGQPTLHQPITVACQQQSGQKDGEFGLWRGRDQEWGTS